MMYLPSEKLEIIRIVEQSHLINIRAKDVTDTLDLALNASGCDSATGVTQTPAAQR
ncbi:hypothetical protein H4W01_001421 [Sphingomonas sp. PL20]